MQAGSDNEGLLSELLSSEFFRKTELDDFLLATEEKA
jgi:hypothetical protein